MFTNSCNKSLWQIKGEGGALCTDGQQPDRLVCINNFYLLIINNIRSVCCCLIFPLSRRTCWIRPSGHLREAQALGLKTNPSLLLPLPQQVAFGGRLSLNLEVPYSHNKDGFTRSLLTQFKAKSVGKGEKRSMGRAGRGGDESGVATVVRGVQQALGGNQWSLT